MAVVYKAFHAATNRYVALKVLPEQLTDQPHFIDRFRQEAQTIANLQHPRILPVFDYGESEGKMYMVMRYLDSGTLQDRLKARSLTLKEINRFLEQLADALGYAHAQNVVHRDLKPSNVLVDAQDNLFLTDFGIAKILEQQTKFTTEGSVMGTPDYMSPEQARGLRVDQRSDLYSLGIILYEMVTGRVPFEADTPLAVILKHINDPLPPPTQLQANLSPAIEAVLLKALAKKPEDRFNTCAELLDAWHQALNQGAVLGRETVAAATPPKAKETVSTAALPPSQNANPLNLLLGLGCVGLVLVFLCVLVVAGGGALATFGLNFGPTPTISRVHNTDLAPTRDAAPAATRTPRPENTRAAVTPTISRLTVSTRTAVPSPTALTLPEAFNVSDNPGESEVPQLVVDDAGTAHVLWLDTTLRNDGDLLYRHRTAEGEWSETETLTEGLREPIRTTVHWLRNPAGQWCAIWAAGLDWQQRCLQNGQWTAPTTFRTEASWADDPVFAYAPDGSVFTLRVDFDVIYFENAIVSDGLNTIDTVQMVLDAAGNPHVVWIESPDDYILKYRGSTDGGKTWGEVETLSEADTHPWLGSALELTADAQGHVHVAWISSPFGPSNKATFYRRWTATEGWAAAVELPGGKPSSEMSLATDANGLAYLAAAGAARAEQGVIYFQQTAAGDWQLAQLIAVDQGSASFSRFPSLFIDATGTPHVVWQAPGVPAEIHYAHLEPLTAP